MKVILSRDIRNLGKVGEVITVKDGYGRNFLLSKKYAVAATKENISKLEGKLEELKEKNKQLEALAKQIADILDKTVFNVVRQAADDDTIYGSIRVKDVFNFINEILKKNNISFQINIGGIKIAEPVKALGQYVICIEIFGDVLGKLRLNVCRAAADFEEDVAKFDKKKEKNLLEKKDINKEVVKNEKQKEDTAVSDKNGVDKKDEEKIKKEKKEKKEEEEKKELATVEEKKDKKSNKKVVKESKTTKKDTKSKDSKQAKK